MAAVTVSLVNNSSIGYTLPSSSAGLEVEEANEFRNRESPCSLHNAQSYKGKELDRRGASHRNDGRDPDSSHH